MGIRSGEPREATAISIAPAGQGRHAALRPGSARRWLIGTVCCVFVIAACVLWIGPAPMMAPWDGFTLLGESYRIYSGQVPNTDFSTPIGPLAYGLVAIGMHMQHSPSLRAVTYSQVIFLV